MRAAWSGQKFAPIAIRLARFAAEGTLATPPVLLRVNHKGHRASAL
jgi:hypothetical protein